VAFGNRRRCIKIVRLKTRSRSVMNVAVLSSHPLAGRSLSADVHRRFSDVLFLCCWVLAGGKGDWRSDPPGESDRIGERRGGAIPRGRG
jgi:hypothetical protein